MAQVKTRSIAERSERIIIQKNSVQVDEYENHTSSWSDYFSAWAYASTYIANEEEKVTVNDERRITFSLRWCSELEGIDSTGYRVMFREEPYNILSVDMMNYGRKEIRLSCRREKR